MHCCRDLQQNKRVPCKGSFKETCKPVTMYDDEVMREGRDIKANGLTPGGL